MSFRSVQWPCCSLSGADATAQGKLSGFVAVGATTPTGDLKDIDSTKSGFMVQGGMEYKLRRRLWLRVDGIDGLERSSIRTSPKTPTSGRSPAAPSTGFRLGTDKLRPYVLGGVGMMLYKRNPGETGLEDTETYMTKNRMLLSAGAGLDCQIGGTSLFVEGRYDMGARQPLA